MKNSIYKLDGLGKVYSFTLSQTFKNKAYRFSFIMMVVMLMVMGPISALGGNAGAEAAKSTDNLYAENAVSGIQLLNKTVLPVSIERLEEALEGTAFSGIAIAEVESIEGLGADEIALVFERRTIEEQSYFVVGTVIADESSIESSQAEALGDHLLDLLADLREENAGLGEAELAILQKSVQDGDVQTQEEFEAKAQGKSTDARMARMNMIYCIVVMILVTLSTSYVVTSVMEEKTSKLVENLLVSVRPMALIMGKVLAMMTYVGLMLVAGVAGSFLSNKLTAVFFNTEASREMADVLDFSAIFVQTGAKSILLVLCLFLSYLMFAILAGLLGSACVKMEDAQSAIGTVSILNIAGYLIGMIVPNIENPTLDMVFSICPFVSSYLAPVYMINDRISLWVFLLGLLVELLVTAALFVICAKTYRKLLVNDSKTLNFFEILKLAGKGA